MGVREVEGLAVNGRGESTRAPPVGTRGRRLGHPRRSGRKPGAEQRAGRAHRRRRSWGHDRVGSGDLAVLEGEPAALLDLSGGGDGEGVRPLHAGPARLDGRRHWGGRLEDSERGATEGREGVDGLCREDVEVLEPVRPRVDELKRVRRGRVGVGWGRERAEGRRRRARRELGSG